jgi:hypothetical protein
MTAGDSIVAAFGTTIGPLGKAFAKSPVRKATMDIKEGA